jgi:hypothetical protein
MTEGPLDAASGCLFAVLIGAGLWIALALIVAAWIF